MNKLRNRPGHQASVSAVEKSDPLAEKAKERKMYRLAQTIVGMSADSLQKCRSLLGGLLADQRMTQEGILNQLDQFNRQRRAVDEDELFEPAKKLDRSPVVFGH